MADPQGGSEHRPRKGARTYGKHPQQQRANEATVTEPETKKQK